MSLLPITWGTLPQPACFATEQERLAAFSQAQKAILNATGSNLIVSDVDPRTIDPTYGNGKYIWFKTSAGATYPAGLQFFMYNGVWATFHGKMPGDIGILPTGKVIADIGNYDGGVATDAITDTTGPFWAEVTELKGRFPMGPDADGGTYPPGGTGGSATHMMTQEELFPHQHRRDPDGHTEDVHVPAGTPGTIAGDYSGGTLAILQYALTGIAGGDASNIQKAMNILPPYFGIPFIRRTARLYRTA